jgi:hypothetical protein
MTNLAPTTGLISALEKKRRATAAKLDALAKRTTFPGEREAAEKLRAKLAEGRR